MSKSTVYSPSRIALQPDTTLPVVLAGDADDKKEAVDRLNEDDDGQNKYGYSSDNERVKYVDKGPADFHVIIDAVSKACPLSEL